MKDFDAVVFDMDGVIFDSERAVLECWLVLSRKYGIRGIEKPYHAGIGTTAARTREIMLAEYGEYFPYDAYAEEVSEMYHERYDGGRLPMKAGTEEILEFLKRSGKKIALASSTRGQTVMNQLADAGILKYFDAVAAGDMAAESKPDPGIFLLACEMIGVSPGRTYAVEDSHNGIRAASRGGLRPVMVPDLLPADEEMRRLSETVQESLEDVIGYLED